LLVIRTPDSLAACDDDDDDVECLTEADSLLHIRKDANMFTALGTAGWGKGNCSFQPESHCQEWCLKPSWTWTQQVPSATHLSCCNPEDKSDAQTVISSESTKQPTDLIVAMLYTDETNMLRQQLRNWIRFSPKLLQQIRFFIAVDTQGQLGDTAPWDIIQQELETLGSQGTWPEIRLIGIHERLNWNVGGKRNLLMHAASLQPAPTWVMLTDVDMSFDESLLSQVLIISGTAGNAESLHKFNRQRPNGEMKVHPGTWLMTSELYWRAGGCDEDFVGSYGWTDPHFDWRARQCGIPTQVHEELVLRELGVFTSDGRDRDAQRNGALYAMKRMDDSWSNHFLRFRFGQISCVLGNRLMR